MIMAEEHLGVLSQHSREWVYAGSIPAAVPSRGFPLPPATLPCLGKLKPQPRRIRLRRRFPLRGASVFRLTVRVSGGFPCSPQGPMDRPEQKKEAI